MGAGLIDDTMFHECDGLTYNTRELEDGFGW
jgi:hypothetical protein